MWLWYFTTQLTRLDITPCGILTNSERNREDSVCLGYFTTQLGYTYYTMEPLRTTRIVAGKMLLNVKRRIGNPQTGQNKVRTAFTHAESLQTAREIGSIVCGWGTSRQS